MSPQRANFLHTKLPSLCPTSPCLPHSFPSLISLSYRFESKRHKREYTWGKKVRVREGEGERTNELLHLLIHCPKCPPGRKLGVGNSIQVSHVGGGPGGHWSHQPPGVCPSRKLGSEPRGGALTRHSLGACGQLPWRSVSPQPKLSRQWFSEPAQHHALRTAGIPHGDPLQAF